jgi:hypothetical protein
LLALVSGARRAPTGQDRIARFRIHGELRSVIDARAVSGSNARRSNRAAFDRTDGEVPPLLRRQFVKRFDVFASVGNANK